MKNKKNKSKIDIDRIVETAVVSIISGIIVSLFSFWLTKTFGYGFLGG